MCWYHPEPSSLLYCYVQTLLFFWDGLKILLLFCTSAAPSEAKPTVASQAANQLGIVYHGLRRHA
jgi:hypothetical protein